jgi:hypothetical protein
VGSRPETPIQGVPYARYIAIGGIVVLLVVLVIVLVNKSHLTSGLAPGTRVPPFAVPLATSTLEGDADIAVKGHEGQLGKVAACKERPPGALNICALYERGPVVLALFFNASSCPSVLPELQAAAQGFPEVSFAAVAIRGQHAEVRRLVHRQRLTMPVGFDAQGALAALYKVLTCPQVNFIYPGGVTQGHALLEKPSPAALQRRVSKLLAASKARGWSPR